MEYERPKIYQTNSFCYDNPLAIQQKFVILTKNNDESAILTLCVNTPIVKKKSTKHKVLIHPLDPIASVPAHSTSFIYPSKYNDIYHAHIAEKE